MKTINPVIDHAEYCALRDAGELPVTKTTVVPGEPPRVPRPLNCQWLADVGGNMYRLGPTVLRKSMAKARTRAEEGAA